MASMSSSIVSILLVIAMAFTSMGGLTANIEDTVSFDAQFSVDAEAIMALSGMTAQTGLPGAAQEQLDEQKDTFKVIGDIISCLTLRGVASKDAAEAAILAGNDVALSVGVKKGDKGVTAASSLLSKNVIFFSDEMIQSVQAEMEKQQAQGLIQNAQSPMGTSGIQAASNALQSLDMEQLAKDIEEAGKKLTEGIEAKKGETETGEFTVDDMTFVSKTPINMTYPEFVEFLLTSAKELAAKESLKPLIDATGKDFGAEIDKAIEELKKQPETNYPEVFVLEIYADADNCTYAVSDMVMAGGDEMLHMAYGDVEGQSRVKFIRNQGEEKTVVTGSSVKGGAFDLTANIVSKTGNGDIVASKDEAGKFSMTCSITGGKQDAKIVVNTEKKEDDRSGIVFDLYFGNAEKPLLSFNGSFGKGGELVSVFEGEEITVNAADELMNNSGKTNPLDMTITAGILKIVTIVTKNVPEETGDWINSKIKEAMMPKTNTTEAPTEQPVVDGN